MIQPIFFQRGLLPHQAVKIHCLDDEGQEIANANASGFLLRETDGLYLYTCWHVVMGIDMHHLPLTMPVRKRVALRLSIQNAQRQLTQSPVQTFVIDGLRTLDIPLYESRDDASLPLWYQDPVHWEDGASIPVPHRHDAVKLRLPDSFQTSEMHVIGADRVWHNLVFPGERMYVVGFPYGFSSRGENQPLAVVLTRFVASTQVADRLGEILLDGTGAPGMSGGPVFVEKDDQLFLLGIYSGKIYTAGEDNKHKDVGSLSTCVDMSLCWTHEVAALRRVAQPRMPTCP